MNRVELIELISGQHELSKAEAGRILVTITDAIIKTVKKNEPVQLVGFGTFRQVTRSARKGFNPSTGKGIKIAQTKVPKFVAGTAFKAAVDSKAAKRKAAAK